jgi:hypothetical protein
MCEQEKKETEPAGTGQENRGADAAAAEKKNAGDTITIKKITLILDMAFIVAAVLMVISFFITLTPFKELMFEIGKAVLIGVFITGTMNRVISDQKKKEEKEEQDRIVASFEKRVNEITEGLSEQTDNMKNVTQSFEAMKNASRSFDSMIHTGIRRIFKSREEIIDTITPQFEKGSGIIYICGVSLNDFLRDEHRKFFELWNDILLERLKENSNLKVKILIINPDSRGAIHRKKAESVNMNWGGGEDVKINDTSNPKQGRLTVDVESAVSDLKQIVEKYHGKIEVHLYNCDPIMFLIWTEEISFVQQYSFRPTHKNYDSIPVVAYGDIERSNFQSYHQELKFHFEWIWNYYSIDIADYTDKKFIGVDTGIIDAGIKNVYCDSKTCRERIKSLIETTEKILWIRGVSLRSFFTPDGEIYNALQQKYVKADPGFSLRVILIDMEAESAKKRALREYKLSGGQDIFKPEDFDKKRNTYEEQKLYVDTRQTLKHIEQFKLECGNLMAGEQQNKKIEVRVSREDPEGFFLVTDTCVLVEQYHFGKLEQKDISAQKLGGEVPVFEFVETDKAKQYTLYKSHFDYLFGISR